MESGEQFIFGLVLNIEAEYIIGLNTVKILAARTVHIPQLFHDFNKSGVVAFDVRVKL